MREGFSIFMREAQQAPRFAASRLGLAAPVILNCRFPLNFLI
jgi:hypothetical protein